MTVEELIEKLQSVDPKLRVFFDNGEWGDREVDTADIETVYDYRAYQNGGTWVEAVRVHCND